ncbi:MAG: hypothetical protein GY913_03430 [Proteobacteria bacterium]|nr:hypothetical protein [Pseudomonadota bacterium]MCP4915952.1 hypothetical protein [Pseudomonadota bacterium]
MPWWRDKTLLIAIGVGLLLRFIPLVLWMDNPCTNDECGYLNMADDLAAGDGMTRWSFGWVWAPGYVSFLAAHKLAFGYSDLGVITQGLLACLAPVLAYELARKHLDLRAARIAAWLFTLSPTIEFFAHHLWGDTLYLLWLLALLWGIDRAREGRLRDAVIPGIFLALCVLFRGIGQYLLPIAAMGLALGRPPRWLPKVGVMALTAVLLVAPYSMYASKKFGGFVISDVTFGANMWLGNNDFQPQTFDWGVGLPQAEYEELHESTGRKHCARKGRTVVEWDQCEKDNGWAWIDANRTEFARRIPLRMTQLFNPNSFLTRHIRKGFYGEMPAAIGHALGVVTIGFSLLAVWGGTIGAFGRGRSWLLPTTLAIVVYHLAAHAMFMGMTRYRMPLDAIWLIWAAGLLADPRATLAGLVGWRRWATLALLALAIPLCLWYLKKGFL